MIFTRLVLLASAWEIYTFVRQGGFEQIGAEITADIMLLCGKRFLGADDLALARHSFITITAAAAHQKLEAAG